MNDVPNFERFDRPGTPRTRIPIPDAGIVLSFGVDRGATIADVDDPYAEEPAGAEHREDSAQSEASPRLSVCAWCQKEGLVIEAPHHEISHGICPRHNRELVA